MDQLFASLPVKGGGHPETVMRGYVIALQGYPEWAIGEAVRAFIRGIVPGASKTFCPRPPELSEAVRKGLEHVYDELARKKREAEYREGRVNPRRVEAPAKVEIPRGPVVAGFANAVQGIEMMRSKTWEPGTVFVFREGKAYGPVEAL